MVFSSPGFLFGFLPITLLLYATAPRSRRNLLLFAVSLVFYAWGEPMYLFLMLVSLTVAYLLGFRIAAERESRPKSARLWMLLSVTVTLSVLFFFKYYNFTADLLHLPQIPALTLPIGISFYTFQILSYTVDLYRGEIAVQKNYISFGTYVALFPQLVAGPIVRYCEVDRQLKSRTHTVEKFAKGVERFCIGLGKKLLLGDALYAAHRYFQGLQTLEPTVLGAWLIIICYTLHLYFDFSGYSDMAIGLGKLFGFDFPENFNYPYISKSITEFWRRWHMTLSSFFREYVYIPLGGNRKGKLKQCRNIAVVWLLTGLWHGAAWNFILWGAYFCVILICEHLFLRKQLEKLPDPMRHLYTMLLVTVSFLIFSYTDLSAGRDCFLALMGIGTQGISTPTLANRLLHLLPLLFAAAVGATPYPAKLAASLHQRDRRFRMTEPLLLLLLLLVCTAYLTSSTYSPFAYFNF